MVAMVVVGSSLLEAGPDPGGETLPRTEAASGIGCASTQSHADTRSGLAQAAGFPHRSADQTGARRITERESGVDPDLTLYADVCIAIYRRIRAAADLALVLLGSVVRLCS